MRDCENDTDGGTGGDGTSSGDGAGQSIEALVGEFEELAGAFRDGAEANRREQESAQEPGAPDEPEGTRLPDQEFEASSYLLVPHFRGRDRKRPIPRRPDAPEAPVKSEAIRIANVDLSMNDLYGDYFKQSLFLEEGEDYEFDCTIQNIGGTEVSNAHVELFVEHRHLDASIDVNADTGTVQLHPNPENRTGGQVEANGYTNLPPDSVLALVVYTPFHGEGPTSDNMVDYTVVAVEDDRTFGNDFLMENEDARTGFGDGDSFKLRVYMIEEEPDDVPTSPRSGNEEGVPNPGELGRTIYQTDDPQRLFLLDEIDGTFTTDPGNDEAPLDLAGNVEHESVELVDRQFTTIPSDGETTLTLTYSAPATRPLESANPFHTFTAFYLRTYDYAESDFPRNWSRLDHTESRFVGRYEAWSASFEANPGP